jgi:hypothetical protein
MSQLGAVVPVVLLFLIRSASQRDGACPLDRPFVFSLFKLSRATDLSGCPKPRVFQSPPFLPVSSTNPLVLFHV